MARPTNLESMSVDQLLKLKSEIENVLSRRVTQLQSELSKLTDHHRKVSASPLAGRKVAIKYRDKTGNTWAGRGATPRWLRERLKAGAKLEQFSVNKQRRAKR
jgi:DNA-binding protein H-NS